MRSHRQRGMSGIATLFVILVAAFCATCVIKLGPAYLESFTIKRAIENVVADAKTKSMSPRQIRSGLSKQFQVNEVDAIQAQDVKITEANGKETLNANYEVRIPLMFNIDVVLKFNKMVYDIHQPSS